jgi:hypothetical protein
MRKLGKTQASILKVLSESPQPILRFSSVKDVLDTLRYRRLVEINGNLVSITKEGSYAINTRNTCLIEGAKDENKKNTVLN